MKTIHPELDSTQDASLKKRVRCLLGSLNMETGNTKSAGADGYRNPLYLRRSYGQVWGLRTGMGLKDRYGAIVTKLTEISISVLNLTFRIHVVVDSNNNSKKSNGI